LVPADRAHKTRRGGKNPEKYQGRTSSRKRKRNEKKTWSEKTNQHRKVWEGVEKLEVKRVRRGRTEKKKKKPPTKKKKPENNCTGQVGHELIVKKEIEGEDHTKFGKVQKNIVRDRAPTAPVRRVEKKRVKKGATKKRVPPCGGAQAKEAPVRISRNSKKKRTGRTQSQPSLIARLMGGCWIRWRLFQASERHRRRCEETQKKK